MMRKAYKNGWILFTQFEHSKLSGEIMDYWGNSSFSDIDPKDEVVYATKNHDRGWVSWDENPRINPENHYPADYSDMYPVEQHRIWADCFNNLPENRSYASALIALHFARFNNNLLKKNPDNNESIAFKNEIEAHVADKLGINPDFPSIGLPSKVAINLKLLQIGDLISHAICHGWTSVVIEDAPLDYSGGQSNLRLTSDNCVNYKIEPYPFFREQLNLAIKGRIILSKTYKSDEDLRNAIKKAEIQNFYFTVN